MTVIAVKFLVLEQVCWYRNERSLPRLRTAQKSVAYNLSRKSSLVAPPLPLSKGRTYNDDGWELFTFVN